MNDQCVFCRIMSGQAEAAVVLDDGPFVAFLDHSPLFLGHTLLAPRQHYDTMLDLPAGLAGELFINAQRVARAVEQALGADGTMIVVNNRVSQSVPHVHVHIIPRRRGDGLKGFFWPRQRYADGEMERVRDAIRAAIGA